MKNTLKEGNPERLSKAYAHCTSIARGHYENFPVGSLLIPRRIRPHFHALYAFMRTADDFADLPHRSRDEKLKLLADWREQLHRAFTDEIPREPIFLALQHTARIFKLDRQPLDLLLDAFEFDARGDVQFKTFDDLRWYTRRSAEPVGQLVLSLFGYKSEEHFRRSNDICTALQLINFMQDAAEDLGNHRYYFPREDYAKFGIASVEDIAQSKRFGELVLYECDRIERLLNNGGGLPEMVRGRLRLELRAVVAGAYAMLKKIREIRGDTLSVRPTLSTTERAGILLSSLFTVRHR